MYTKYCEINAMWNWLCGLYNNLGNDSFFLMFLWGRVAVIFNVWWRTYVFAPNRESHKTMGISWHLFGHEIRNLNFWNTYFKLVLITAVSAWNFSKKKVYRIQTGKKSDPKKYHHQKSRVWNECRWCEKCELDSHRWANVRWAALFLFVFHRFLNFYFKKFVFAHVWIGL